MICPALISGHVAAFGWNDRPPTPGRALWRLYYTQRGKDLVPNPAEAIVAATKCSLPSGVGLSVYRHGVRTIVKIPVVCEASSSSKYLNLVMQVRLLPDMERTRRFH